MWDNASFGIFLHAWACMLRYTLASEKDANFGSPSPNAMLLTTGICQLFLHWLGDTRMWNMLPMLATRFGKEFNDIDDHRFRNILADVAQIGRIPPKSM